MHRRQAGYTLRFAVTTRGLSDEAMLQVLIAGLRRAGIPERVAD